MKKRRLLKFLFYYTIFMVVLTIFFIWGADFVIRNAAKEKTYTSIKNIPFNKTGLLLGTAKTLASGNENLYYTHRIDAAEALIKAGKIKYLVISGDNSRLEYNEPVTMKNDLVVRGVDPKIIYLDYAGFRTFDSMVRLREIFSQDSVTVISQQFHNERAIYIAQKENIHAVGFNAEDVPTYYGVKTNVREKLARAKVFIDYVTNVKPKFLGEKVVIGE